MRFKILAICACVSICQTSVRADLIVSANPSGESVVHDDVGGLYWLNDQTDLVWEDYSAQMTEIASMNAGPGYFGATDWRLASAVEVESLFAQISGPTDFASLFNPTLHNNHGYHSARYGVPRPGSPFGGGDETPITMVRLAFPNGEEFRTPADPIFMPTDLPSAYVGAWAVATGPVAAPVPTPTAFLLGGIGLACANWRLKRRKAA